MDASQKFCLKWNNFQSSVTSVFDALRQDGELVDITLCCEGRKIKAHRMMLSACSPYFRDLLKENPCQHPVFFLKDAQYEDLAAVVEFVYKGEVNVTQAQLASFLKTAEMLQVRGLAGEEDGPPSAAQTPVSQQQQQTPARPSAPSPRPEPPPVAVKRPRLSPEPGEPTAGNPRPPELAVKQERLESEPADSGGSDGGYTGASGTGQGGFDLVGYDTVPTTSAAADVTAFLGAMSEHGGSGELALHPPAGPSDDGTPQGGGRRRWSCQLCGKHYQHSISLSQHMSVHRGHTTCRLCARVFSRVAKLNDHLERVHGVLRRARRMRYGSASPAASPGAAEAAP